VLILCAEAFILDKLDTMQNTNRNIPESVAQTLTNKKG
jgi:hypothetical protein